MNQIPMRWGKGATRTVVQIKNGGRRAAVFCGFGRFGGGSQRQKRKRTRESQS